MIGKVFRIFHEKGGILKALGLWEWFESLNPKEQKLIKHYFSLKSIKELKFPFRAKHFDSGEVDTFGYTRAKFLGSIAQRALLERDYQAAKWLYTKALELSETPLEKHLILNDLVLLAQKLKDFDLIESYALSHVNLFLESGKEILKDGQKIQLNSLEVIVYLLERKGEVKKALEIMEKLRDIGVEHPFYNEVRARLESKLEVN